MEYYIGVDGGGTKTQYTLFDGNKNEITSYKGPGSNHENYEKAFDEAAPILWDGLNKVAGAGGVKLEDVKFTLMGLAGIDHRFQYDIMCGKLKEYGLKNFEIFNDGFIVVKAGSRTGAAIGYNCGTGTCCNAIDSKGAMLQLAGFSDFSGDVGNGHWIAIRVFKLIYDELYLGLEKTSLTSMVFKEYQIGRREEFLGILEGLSGEKAEQIIMRFIDFFFEAANRGDAPVMKAVHEMAQRGAELIAAHANQLCFEGGIIEVVLSGSIHTKLPSDVYIELMKKKLGERCSRVFQFIKLDKPPVFGCINWILQEFVK